MIKIPYLNGFDYVKEDYDIYIQSLDISGWTKYDLGESTAEGKRIYGLSWGDLDNKPTIYLQGQMHGAHEWRTAYWVRKFAELISNPPSNPKHKLIFEYLRNKYSFYIIPCANPYGYINNYYGNGNGVNLTRNFSYLWDETPLTPYSKGAEPFSENETQVVRDIVLQYKPVGFLCAHSWGGYSGFTIRRGIHRIFHTEMIYHDYFDSTVLSTGVSTSSTDTKLEFKLNVSSAYNWAGQQISSNGKNILATVLETGTLETEYEQARLGLTGLLMFCLCVDNYFTNNTLILNS